VDTRHSHEDETPTGLHHEVKDVHVRPIALSGFALALLIALSFGAMKGLFDYADRRHSFEDVAPSPMGLERPQQPPEPRLQTTPVPNRKLITENERNLLNSYGWADQKAGKVRIPVSQAMKLVVERGLPVRSRQQTADSRKTEAGKKPGITETEKR